MSYDYSDSLPAEAAKRYQEKLQSLGLEKCPYKLPADDWIDDPTEWPSLTYHHLYHYLIRRSATSVNTPALNWGRNHEDEAITLYENVFANPEFITDFLPVTDVSTHENFKVGRLGLCIHTVKQWYGSSPDAATSCDCCGFGVLEVKCPYSLKEKSLKKEIYFGKFYITYI
ncbi:uncharacterized protein LOC130645074 isoform X2 [Hydractinia symbiolongicarpus]|uniref:uncharacterized protein LOC130645074 isoform X2 n=1 Tax=Hydractinia symbiolongicarpus TaxID=13093 RepID=UPI00255163F4|nr:uncharacterized protein LOC130645074 isoform X2 [Hydractinia symbiolongicarpus]